MYFKILIILFILLYQNVAYSKATDKNDFNQKYLSNYFSALVSSNNQKNDDAIIFFNSSKFLNTYNILWLQKKKIKIT